jgi:hypothetical protein
MISDRRRGSDQSWTARATELANQLDGLRAKKVNQRELARQLKTGNFKSLEECIMLEAIEAMLSEPRIPKTAEASDLVGKLQGIVNEASELREKAVSLKDAQGEDARVKDLINEAAKLKVGPPDAGQLHGTSETCQRRARRSC